MTKPEAARYRTTNWKSYNSALRRRGSLLIWLDKDMEWLAPKTGSNGRPSVFSDAAVQFCLMVKVLFGLPLRQTTGMVASILSMAGLDWPVPDCSTLSRRQKTIEVQITQRRVPGPLNLLVDSTGIKFLGDGEWLVRKHGTHRRRHTAILERGGTAIIPIRKNGRRWKEDCPAAVARNEILRATQRLGRTIWKRWSGYHARSRVEAKMRCLKAFGERIASRAPDRQTAEIHIRIALMNRFNALGTAEIERVA